MRSSVAEAIPPSDFASVHALVVTASDIAGLQVGGVRIRKMETTRRAVEQQVAAMGASVYEVGLYNPDAERVGEPVMIPRTWDVAGLLRSIPWLRWQNSIGRNIYIRPRGEHDLSLVDDLAASSLERMRAAGFAPALIVETSPGNFQAWLKHACTLRKELSTAAARRLAAEFGGASGAADWRPFGRMVGATNRKEKHRQSNGLFPFVRLIEASGREYAVMGRDHSALSGPFFSH